MSGQLHIIHRPLAHPPSLILSLSPSLHPFPRETVPGKIMVKFTLEQARKAKRKRRGIAPLFL
jgi:hypothetical protein